MQLRNRQPPTTTATVLKSPRKRSSRWVTFTLLSNIFLLCLKLSLCDKNTVFHCTRQFFESNRNQWFIWITDYFLAYARQAPVRAAAQMLLHAAVQPRNGSGCTRRILHAVNSNRQLPDARVLLDRARVAHIRSRTALQKEWDLKRNHFS